MRITRRYVHCDYVYVYICKSHDLRRRPSPASLSASAMRQPSTRPEVYALASRHSRAHAARTPCGSPRSPTSLPLRLPRTADASARAELIALKSALLSKPALATAHAWRMLRPVEPESELDAYKTAAFVGFLGVLRNKPPTYGCTATAPSQTSYSPLCSPYSPSPHLLTHRPPRVARRPPLNLSLPPPAPHPPAPQHMHGARTARAQRPRAPCASRAINRSSGLAAAGEACKRWLERAAVSISASMVVRVPTLPPRRLDTLRAHAKLCPLRSHPSSDGTDAEQGAAPLSTLSTAARIRILPLPAHVGALVASVHGAVCDKSMHHGEKEEASSLVSRTTEVWERGDCWDIHDCRDTRDGRESSENREGQADARPLPAGVPVPPTAL
ncbi:hypothetical protein C8J57DRAFT_1522287 [Mycena rebaudengoi]|nr:hypothetical protein C8J57DRAFT_1522287 [Mycena rebaudengoi]